MAGPVHSSATAGFEFTESSLEFVHLNGVAESGSLLVCAIGSIDSQGPIQALGATFSGATAQSMTLAHSVVGNGNAFPSLHIFTLTEPTFSGTPSLSGVLNITFDQAVSNINALSVCITGVNTVAQGFDPASIISSIDTDIRSTGMVSGTLVTADVGELMMDFVMAQAGIPNDHTVGGGQTLVGRIPMNNENSSALSVSTKVVINSGELGMARTAVTSIQTVSSTAMVILMH